jgi:hypothetical protein
VRLEVRLLAITFVESIGTVLLERGLYFFTHERLQFSERQNLLIAFLFGVVYVIGALGSHRTAARFGEKRVLIGALVGLLVLHSLLVLAPSAIAITSSFVAIGLLQGLKWPIVESFFGAGLTPRELVRSLGRFNVCWAVAVPIGVAGSGPLIGSGRPELFFGAAALLNVLALGFSRKLPQSPLHLELDHPERPDPAELARYGALLVSARFTLLLSYTLMFLLAPLMPALFSALGLGVRSATLAASALDVVRVVCFGLLGAFIGWRSRWSPLVWSNLCLLGGFTLILWGSELGLVLAGELLFGLGAGIAYTAALYYALVVKNAAVDAGGAHEGLIGVGFALGPLCGLAGNMLKEREIGGAVGALLIALGPICCLCIAGALAPYFKLKGKKAPDVPV